MTQRSPFKYFKTSPEIIRLRTKARLALLLPDMVRAGLTTDPCLMHTAVAYDDEDVASYIRRTVSDEFLESYVEPFFRAPWHWEPETISRAYLLSVLAHVATGDELSFSTGIGRLTRALAERLDVRLGVEARRVRQREGGGATVELRGADGPFAVEADVVVMAVEGVRAAAPVEGLSAGERAFFSTVRYNPGARVYTASSAATCPRPDAGSPAAAPPWCRSITSPPRTR